MATVEEDVYDSGKENILYDLTIHAEWPHDSEIFARGQREKPPVSALGRIGSASRRSAWTLLRAVGVPLQSTSSCSLPANLVSLVDCQINWNIAVSRDGKTAAILQDQCVEIRSSRDDYGTILGRGIVPKDPNPQWRQVSFSPDGTVVACSTSSGVVDLFDIVGTHLFSIKDESSEKAKLPLDLSEAVASLVFTDYKPPEKWFAELLIVNYHGKLRSVLIDHDNGFSVRHQFLFSYQYPWGVSSVVYVPGAEILLVGGCGQVQGDFPTESVREGLTAWRILSDYPHYKFITDYEEDLYRAQQKRTFLKRLKVIKAFGFNREPQDGIFKLCVSPNQKMLAALHYSGKLSVWHIPSLRLQSCWDHQQQPWCEDLNPDLLENPLRRKTIKDLILSKFLLDVNWWSDKAIILARSSGAVTISCANTLENLLGKSPEWFEPAPHVTAVHDGGFLGLEVESKFPMKRRLVDGGDDEYEDSDDEDITWVSKTTRFTKQMLYYVSDSERLRPPKKRPKIVNRIYRLVCLKSTTPEELFARKIDHEEYGEALALAKAYGLDSDLVYQRQWRKSPVSVASIQDYLSKISKRSWVLHECLERVPDSIDAMKELMEFGLRGTDLQALIVIGKGEDGGRFILCDPEDGLYDDMSFDEFSPEDQRKKQEMMNEKTKQLLAEVNFPELNLSQQELCRARMKLLQYLDRLKTYEYIMGGVNAAAERFDSCFFEKFRSQNIVDVATEYARSGDWKALEALFTFHADPLTTHRLAILSNFPETKSPFEYRALLPEVRDDCEVVPLEGDKWREDDWCELVACRTAVDPTPIDLGAFLYEEQHELEKFRSGDLDKKTLSEWYKYQACKIERMSRQVDNALELVKLAIERGVEDMSELLDDLITMEMLVYECHVDETLTFDQLRDMADYEKLEIMMSKSTLEMYVKNLHRWMVPFLKQCQRRSAGSYDTLLRDYVVTQAKSDLTICVKLFEASKANVPNPVISNRIEMISVAMEALYVCERDDQWNLACDIVKCLPQKASGEKKQSLKWFKQKEKLEHHLQVAKIMDHYGIPKPLSFIKQSESDPEEAKNLVVKLTRSAGRKIPNLSEKEWMTLLDDIVQIQKSVYSCITPALCIEVFTESLLCSTHLENIRLAGNLIEQKADVKRQAVGQNLPPRVPYETSIELVLSAAQEYFNSSANLMDSCMELARSCLNLIQDLPDVIQEELDLIGSLALLDDFGVAILPLQVRLCKNRLELVKKAVQSRPSSYRHSQKLMRLGHLLRVTGETMFEKQGKVLYLVVKAAVEIADYHFASNVCQQLIESGYGPAWEVCVDLASKDDFRNPITKVELLTFAVTFCTADMIESILQAKAVLEMELLFEAINHDIEERRVEATGERLSPFTAKGALSQTKKILSSTSDTTRAVLSTVTDTKWWQNTIQTLKQPVPRQLSNGGVDHNTKCDKQGCHPFYEGIIDNHYCHFDSGDIYSIKFHTDSEVLMSEKILRTAKLEEMLTEGEKNEPATQVLAKLATMTIPLDSSLGLAYLLALPQPLDAVQCFDSFSGTAITLQLAVYYFALQIYSAVKPCKKAKQHLLYKHSPTKLIQEVVRLTNRKDVNWPQEVLDLLPKLKHYNALWEDYTQAKALLDLGRGVDLVRFTEDNEYKKETILGLVMSLEEDVYDLSVSLAERYDIPLWQVYMAHVEFLFADSGIPIDAVEERIEKMNLLKALTANPEEFATRMHTYVYPSIADDDHDSLLLYYKLLCGCGKDVVKTGLTPDNHVKLLRRIKPVAEGLQYKSLMDGSKCPIEIVKPVLCSKNVAQIAKIGSRFPDGKGGFLDASIVYCAWAIKLFWEGDGKRPNSTAAWVHRFEACGEWTQKLRPQDMINFLDSLVFVPESRKKLELECRREITRRMLKISKKGGGKKKQNGAVDTGGSDSVTSQIQARLDHLDTFNNETVQSLSIADNKQSMVYAEQYDLSRGKPEVVKTLLTWMVLEGQPIKYVSDLLSASLVSDWTASTMLQEAIKTITSKYRGESVEFELSHDWNVALEKVIDNVEEHQEHGDLVTAEDVMTILRPFCSDDAVDVTTRLWVLHTLERSFHLSEEDQNLLIFYSTAAIVKAAWSGHQLSEGDIKSDDDRRKLFQLLLKQSRSHFHFSSLTRLLRLWPPLKSIATSPPSQHPWVQVLACLAALEDASYVLTEMREIKDTLLSEQGVEHIYKVLLDHGHIVEGAICVLLSGQQRLFQTAIQQVLTLEQVPDDVELFCLILENNLITTIVSTFLYPPVIRFLIANPNYNEESQGCLPVERTVNQLRDSGFEAEAGSLLLESRSTHPVLRTFGAALGAVGKWLDFKS